MNECSHLFAGCLQCELPYICSNYSACPEALGFHRENQLCVKDQPCADPSPYCKSCLLNSLKCAKCFAGAYAESTLNSGEVRCAPCDETCEQCTGPSAFECIECTKNYAFQHFDGQTVCALQNCVKYADESLQQCAECVTGYFGRQCTPCASECASCVGNATNCTQCAQGHVLIAGTCVSTLEHCKSFDEEILACQECQSGYYNHIGTCAKCSASCKECDQDNLCLQCAEGYQIANSARDFPQKCFPVNPRCRQFDATGVCIVCADNYAISSVGECLALQGQKCTAEGDCWGQNVCLDGFCRSCKLPTFYSNGRCESCTQGLGIKYDQHGVVQCVPCQIDKCANCESNAATCQDCVQGYVLKQEKCRYQLQRSAATGAILSVVVAAAIGATVIAWLIIRHTKVTKTNLANAYNYQAGTIDSESVVVSINDPFRNSHRESNASVEPGL